MSQALYRTYRPHSWKDVIGQDHIITVLQNAVAADRVAHAYLFAGPRGTGKTSTARILAKAVNCTHPDLSTRPCDACSNCEQVNDGRFLDLIEIDAASNTSVDDVRDLRDKINFSPNSGRFKVYIIDEVHMLSTAAFNALLKTLEEPPAHAMFILATTEVHKIPATVTSRCQRHEFRRIGATELIRSLERIAGEEGLEVERAALELIARQATGSMRDAISLLDQLASSGEAITFALAQDVLGTATNQAVLDLIDALAERDAAAGLDVIHRTLDTGSDPRQFARQIVESLRFLLLSRVGSGLPGGGVSPEVRGRMAAQAERFRVPELLVSIEAFQQAAVELKNTWQPSLALEIALVECLSSGSGTATSAAVPQAGGEPRPKRPAVDPEKLPERPASGGEGGALEELRRLWPAVRAAVRKQKSSTEGLLNSCKLLEVRGAEVFLGFASETVKGIMESENHLEVAQRCMEDVVGRKMVIRCVIASDADEIPDDVTSDGMVAAAMRLGGKIAHSRDVPKGKAN